MSALAAAQFGDGGSNAQNSKAQGWSYVNGKHRRKCLCEKDLCVVIWRHWCNPINDSGAHRDLSQTGYQGVPLYQFEAKTPLFQLRNKIRMVYFRHLFPREDHSVNSAFDSAYEKCCSRGGNNSTAKRETGGFVALHHFPRNYLKEDGSGLIDKFINDPMPLNLTDNDQIRIPGHPNDLQYIVPPLRPWKEIVNEFLISGGQIPYHLVDKNKTMSSPSPVQRTNPRIRATTMLANSMKQCPNKFAVEFQKIEAQLLECKEKLKHLTKSEKEAREKLAMTLEELGRARETEQHLLKQLTIGVSRKNILSPEWHSRNPGAASHFFGGQFEDFEDVKGIVTFVWFPDMEICTDVNGPISEFEKVLMALMRCRRAYDHETIGYIFGIDRRRVGEYLKKYTPMLAHIGRMMSILDLDLTHDFISREIAEQHGLPHYEL